MVAMWQEFLLHALELARGEGMCSSIGRWLFCTWSWSHQAMFFQVEELNKKLTQHEKATCTQQQRIKVKRDQKPGRG